MPDETTILIFRHLLRAHQLAQSLFGEVVSLLTERGLILGEGRIIVRSVRIAQTRMRRYRQESPNGLVSQAASTRSS